ncbi:hypothetical protein HYH02_003918 [Chlamydomonas schloesseri]|uniref:Uncharacterized protein n=1 Tax=Chlamydomonas schloesseri TaxID=2026947 RepID=A0A836B8Z9_9CHLO|nr:hypothetical protein HYH02_003918 [Chlamydomonas schloesseri]|eukprot:KAG2451312.1 hypothetical protein HYH02_003918 [Chlamydomonas schloesseri]
MSDAASDTSSIHQDIQLKLNVLEALRRANPASGDTSHRAPALKGLVSAAAVTRLQQENFQMAVRDFLQKPVPPPRVEQATALSHLVRRTHNRLRSKEMRDREAVEARMAQREPWAATLAKDISRTHFRTRGRYDTGSKYPHLAAPGLAPVAGVGAGCGAGSGDTERAEVQAQERQREPLLVMLQTRKLLGMVETVLDTSGAVRVGQQQAFLSPSPVQRQQDQQGPALPAARPQRTRGIIGLRGVAGSSSGVAEQEQLAEAARVWAGAATAITGGGESTFAHATAPQPAVLPQATSSAGGGIENDSSARGLRVPELRATLFALARYGHTTQISACEDVLSPAGPQQQASRADCSRTHRHRSTDFREEHECSSSGSGSGSRSAAGKARRRREAAPNSSSEDASAGTTSRDESEREGPDETVEVASAAAVASRGLEVDGAACGGGRAAVAAGSTRAQPPARPSASAASEGAASAAAASAAVVASAEPLLSAPPLPSPFLAATEATMPNGLSAVGGAGSGNNTDPAVDAAARLPGYVQRLPVAVQQHVLADSLQQLLACSRGLIARAEGLLGCAPTAGSCPEGGVAAGVAVGAVGDVAGGGGSGTYSRTDVEGCSDVHDPGPSSGGGRDGPFSHAGDDKDYGGASQQPLLATGLMQAEGMLPSGCVEEEAQAAHAVSGPEVPADAAVADSISGPAVTPD